jgi:hypothetical protein
MTLHHTYAPAIIEAIRLSKSDDLNYIHLAAFRFNDGSTRYACLVDGNPLSTGDARAWYAELHPDSSDEFNVIVHHVVADTHYSAVYIGNGARPLFRAYFTERDCERVVTGLREFGIPATSEANRVVVRV